jgi:hypothetical protein
MGNLGLTTLQRYLAGHGSIGCCQKQRWNRSIINESKKTFNRNWAGINTAEGRSFAHTHPISQVTPIRRGPGWPPTLLAFLIVDMCRTQFIFQHSQTFIGSFICQLASEFIFPPVPEDAIGVTMGGNKST